MLCGSKGPSTAAGAGVHKRVTTFDGKCVIACSPCRTRKHQDCPPIKAEAIAKLKANWLAYIKSLSDPTPAPDINQED